MRCDSSRILLLKPQIPIYHFIMLRLFLFADTGKPCICKILCMAHVKAGSTVMSLLLEGYAQLCAAKYGSKRYL